MNNLESMINNFISLELEDIPDGAIERAKWVLLDTLFVAWYGNKSEELQNYMESIKSNLSDADEFPIIGEGIKTSAYHQLVIHGTSIVGNEMDEGSQYAKGHPAAHTFPPALAAALENNSDGKEFLRAFIIGYEICARFADAVGMNDDMHPHGTWGMIGGTVAAGLLQNKTSEEIIEAVYLSASLPLATSWQSAVTGQTVRNLYTGLSCWQAYNTTQLQSHGFRSSIQIVEHLWGSILSKKGGIDQSKFNTDSPFLISRNYFKLFPACRFSHPSIDAINNIFEENSIDADDIDRIEAETYGLAARLDNPDPDTLLASKFSIPFLISVIVNGYSLFETEKELIFQNKNVRNFANKVSVKESLELNKLLPHKRAAEVSVYLKDGTVKSSMVDTASGEYNLPLTKEIMKNKIVKISGEHLSDEAIEKIIENTLNIESAKSIDEWVNLISNMQET